MSPQPPRKQGAKVEGRDETEKTSKTMEPFKALTRRLLRVSRDELAERQRLYEQRPNARTKRTD